MSDISHLFPNLARTLDDWDGRKAAGDGSDDPSHGGVTDEDIENYLSQMGALRNPFLTPVVSGQQPPLTPEFGPQRGNRMPPPPSHMEAPDPAATGDVAAAQEGLGVGEVPEPPPSPDEPEPPPPDDDGYDLRGRRYSRPQLEAWADFDARIAQDPQLRTLIQNYLSGQAAAAATAPQTAPAAPQTAPSPPPLTQPLPPLPALPEGYEGDEAITALYAAVRAQRDALDRISAQSAQAERIAASQAQRTYSDIARGAMTEFQKARNLPDDVMQAVSRAAASTGFAEKYMQGFDPLTGTPVAPDPYNAVMSALNAGYMMTPQTRDIEITRQMEARVARARDEQSRKQKLAGISGSSGSVPRTQTIPTNPQDARAAMTEEINQMFNGSWVGDGSN